MPEGAGSSRAEAMAGLARVKHELLRDLRIGEWLDAAEHDEGLGEWEKANLHEMGRTHRRAVGVPSDLVEASSGTDWSVASSREASARGICRKPGTMACNSSFT